MISSAKQIVGSSVWLVLLLGTVAAEDLTVLCGVDEVWCRQMEAAFENESGISISMTRRSTGEILEQIRLERANPMVDVWWGGTGDTHLQAAAEGLLTQYRSVHEDDLLPWANNFYAMSGGQAAGIYAGALGFAYNTELLAKNGIPAPACWKDLAGDAYRGHVLMANPATSGTAYTALSTLVQLFGEDEAFAYLASLDDNIGSYTISGAAPVKRAARGEAWVGISFIHDAVTQQATGAPLSVVAPCEGTGYEIGAVSIVSGSRHLEEARLFVDFALSPAGQATGAVAGQNQVPSNERAVLPAAAPDISLIRMVDYDFATFGSPEQRSRLLARFVEEVTAGR